MRCRRRLCVGFFSAAVLSDSLSSFLPILDFHSLYLTRFFTNLLDLAVQRCPQLCLSCTQEKLALQVAYRLVHVIRHFSAVPRTQAGLQKEWALREGGDGWFSI
ncbi:hypothetical protein LXA43DRAFT_1027101 [Ganoderma leucocontextum]|nr:hypothetical protein LXA43DRAFT_1027101 [Ganoderma leucocontextum]